MPSAVPTDYKRIFLRSLKWDSEDSGLSLLQTLKLAARARLSETKSGKVLIGTAANGKSASFSIPAGATVTPLAIVTLCSELLDWHAQALVLLAARAIPAPSDQQIFDEILAFLQPTFETANDYSLLDGRFRSF